MSNACCETYPLPSVYWNTTPMDRMTDASENITLPQTPFVGGSKYVIKYFLLWSTKILYCFKLMSCKRSSLFICSLNYFPSEVFKLDETDFALCILPLRAT